MCPSCTTASPARKTNAGFLARMASRLGLRARGTASRSGAVSGPAENTAPKSKPDGKSMLTPDRLRARAMMQNNRNADQVAAYVARHMTLIKGR